MDTPIDELMDGSINDDYLDIHKTNSTRKGFSLLLCLNLYLLVLLRRNDLITYLFALFCNLLSCLARPPVCFTYKKSPPTLVPPPRGIQFALDSLFCKSQPVVSQLAPPHYHGNLSVYNGEHCGGVCPFEATFHFAIPATSIKVDTSSKQAVDHR